jgi:5'-deoxynucleotidase YfbR-like HD superfamily hydrolase
MSNTLGFDRGVLYTYSGKIAFPDGAPSLMDIAISLSREGRYAGAGVRFWPVALHTFVVCDLLPQEFKFDGLIHDSAECITGDIPKPVKTDAIEQFEEKMTRVIYSSFKIAFPSPYIRQAVKDADIETRNGEVYTVGTQALQEVYGRSILAEDLIHKYVDKYNYGDYLESSGRVPMEFMRRFREYKGMLPKERLL